VDCTGGGPASGAPRPVTSAQSDDCRGERRRPDPPARCAFSAGGSYAQLYRIQTPAYRVD
jgi:hypothetical protein